MGFDGFANVAEAAPSEAIFAALGDLARATVGARLVSCSVFDRASRQARRVYTDNPDVYPLSGLKEVTPNRWTEIVIDRGEMFVANTLEEIRGVFPDHETIAGLGLGSIINLPVLLAGTFVGTVNMLDRPRAYGQEQIAAAKTLRLPAIAAFASLMLAERHARKSTA